MSVLAVCLLCLLITQSPPWQRVISFGADLTPEDRVAVVRDFALPPEVNTSQIPTVTVEHREEVELLQGVAPSELIGTKAVSSVYLEADRPGAGLLVNTKNITWVTPEMYANAMATAGVRDARAFVTAPVPVSGTAALTGIFKAFSNLSGRVLSPAAQEAAAQELVRTGELGQRYGKDEAATFMVRLKEEAIRTRAATMQEIEEVIARVAREQNLSLTTTEKQLLADYLARLTKLDLDLENLRAQLKNFADAGAREATGLDGLLARLLDFLRSLFQQLVGFVGRCLRWS
ncbi:MAG: DUF1002 domain-containing protein [Bacteroidota bacterium]